MKTTRFARSGTAQRDAYTLIELMVVITIIVALMALTASAVLKFIEVQQNTNTQSTLDRVQSQLGRAWSKVKDAAYKEPIPPPVAAWIQAYLSAPDANATERVRYIYVKLKMRQAFPMNFNEALFPPTLPPPAGVCPLPPLSGYVTYLKNTLGITVSTGAPYESSACLLMALQRGVSGAGIDPAELTTGGAAGSIVTPLGGNLPYLTDAWGRPIFFTRAPAGNLNLNPITPKSVVNSYTLAWGPVICYSQPGNNDPNDPLGYFQTPNWGIVYGPAFSVLTSQVIAAGNTSYKLVPMVASGGPVNWLKTGTPTLDPITFYTPSGSGVLYSTP